MIGKSTVGSRPATLTEVESIMSKRLEEAEEEMKRRKKEKKVAEKPPEPPPAPVEGAEGDAVAPAPPQEEKSPLGLEQRSALEYAKKFSKLGKRKAEEMMGKLMKLEKMKPEAAAKIIDIMPLNDDQVRLIFTKEKISASEKELSAVMKIVEEFRK